MWQDSRGLNLMHTLMVESSIPCHCVVVCVKSSSYVNHSFKLTPAWLIFDGMRVKSGEKVAIVSKRSFASLKTVSNVMKRKKRKLTVGRFGLIMFHSSYAKASVINIIIKAYSSQETRKENLLVQIPLSNIWSV